MMPRDKLKLTINTTSKERPEANSVQRLFSEEEDAWCVCPYQRYFARAIGEQVPTDWKDRVEQKNTFKTPPPAMEITKITVPRAKSISVSPDSGSEYGLNEDFERNVTDYSKSLSISSLDSPITEDEAEDLPVVLNAPQKKKLFTSSTHPLPFKTGYISPGA